MINFLSKNQKVSKEQGFTLVEVVLVLSVTAISFLAIYSLYANTVRSDVEIRYEIIASNLAQEGIEIMRNIRDEEQMQGNDIVNGFSVGSGTACFPYFNGDDSCCDATVRIASVEYDGTRYRNCNFAGGCGGGITPFTRQCVYAQETGGGGETIRMTVVCTVSWNSFTNSSLTRKVEATAVMTNWLWN